MTHELLREQFLPVSLEEAFDFFRDPTNLQVITPPWMGFFLAGPPPDPIEKESRIDFRIRLLGVPMNWRTRISRWEPPHAFVDLQEQGPYAYWEHLHALEAVGDGVLMRDHVRYRLPLAPLSAPIHAVAVRPVLDRIFDHRFRAIRDRFGQASFAASG